MGWSIGFGGERIVGPTSLGSNMNDICGVDWVYGGSDHGDPDLTQAISHLK